MITKEDVKLGMTNTVNINKIPEYIENSNCGVCGRKLKYGEDYGKLEVGGIVRIFYTTTSYEGKVFLDCRRCHNSLVFTDKIRFWIMKILMRI